MQKNRPGHLIIAARQFITDNWPVFVWAFLYLLVAGALHLYFALLVEGDVPYHAAVGRLIREHGILYSFPWTPLSWPSDNYADDRLLFHLMYVPFAGLHWMTAAKIVGTLAGASILTVFYLIVRAERVRFAGLWALVPLAASLIFIDRFLMVRPHLLSVALALVFLWAAVRNRLVIVAAVSVFYPWTYIAFWQLPLLLLIAAAAARLLAGERVHYKPAAAAVLGILVGVAIHPNSVNLLRYNWIVMYDVLFRVSWMGEAGFDMGRELNPLPLGGWVQALSISVILTITAAVYGWRNRRKDMLPLAFTIAAAGFCVLTVRSARFSEYFVPLSVAAFAFASRTVNRRFLAPAVLGISLIFTLLVGLPTFSIWTKQQDHLNPDVISVFQQNIPPGSMVFTPDWNSTSMLMLALPERKFLVVLDPTLFYLKNPELYRLWYQISHEAPPGTARTIRERFGSRYVIVNNRLPIAPRFNYRLYSEPGVRMLLNTKKWMFFDLGSL